MKKILEQLVRHRRCLAAGGAGLLLAGAFPKFSLAGFAWIAPALMLAAAHGKSGGERFRLGYVSGLAFWLASLYWLLLIPVTGFPILGWLALSAFVALFTGVWVWLIPNFQFPISNFQSWTGRTLWTLGGAAAWVALEMARARIFGGFPWSFLGVSQYQLIPLIQIASFTGVYGVSFLVVWFSLALYSAALMIFRHPATRHVWQAETVLPLTVTVLCFVSGFFWMNRGVTTETFLRATLIQPDIPQSVIWNPATDENVFQKFLGLNEAALTNQTDLLVWPESAVPEMSEENCRAISALARKHHVWLILNGEDVAVSPAATNYFNAAFLVNPQGILTASYHKQKLVIFGEYVPLANWLPFLKWFTPITGGWTPGDKPVTFEIVREPNPPGQKIITIGINGVSPRQKIKISPLICFEDTFPGTARKAAQDDIDFLVNLTNDGWFGNSAEQWQHLANAVFRAVENGLPLLRCANNGVTCLIDGHGRIEKIFRDQNGSEYGQGALTVEIPLLQPDQKSAPTFYNRHGDWFGWGCVGITLLLLCRKILAGRKPPA